LTEEEELLTATKFVDGFCSSLGSTKRSLTMPEFSVFASALDSDWQLSQPEFDGLCVAANSGGAIGAADLLALYKDPAVDQLPRAMMSSHLSRCVALHSAYEYGLTSVDRWNAASTAQAYGVKAWWGLPVDRAEKLQQSFAKAVPEAHKEFLRRLEFIVDLPVQFSPGRLLCVHAGLVAELPAEQQIQVLKTAPQCSPKLMSQKPFKIDQLRGRASVFPSWFGSVASTKRLVGHAEGLLASASSPHKDLVGKAVVVVGHAGYHEVAEHQMCLDASGGVFDLPLEAMVFEGDQRTLLRTSTRSNTPRRRSLGGCSNDHFDDNVKQCGMQPVEDLTDLDETYFGSTVATAVLWNDFSKIMGC